MQVAFQYMLHFGASIELWLNTNICYIPKQLILLVIFHFFSHMHT